MMKRWIIQDPITIRELTNLALKAEALRQRDNHTFALYKMTVDRTREEALYVGNERIAIVTWEGKAHRCENVDSAVEAMEHVLDKKQG
jgi:hypothetical protein